MGLATLCSRVLGLVREQVFAFLFGASDATDAFNIAFRIPNLLRDLFAEGAMSAAFVPNFTRALAQSREAAFRLLVAVLSVLLFSLSIISIAGMVFAPELVSFYADAYRAVPGKFELSISLTRMMFPFFPLVAMAAVTMGALNALGSFFLPAFAPVLFNVASIVCGLALTPLIRGYTLYPPIYSMALGVVLGGFLQFYVQWRQMRRRGLEPRRESGVFFKPWRVEGVKRVLWLLVPGTIGLAATQLNILVNSIFATSQGSGAVSWLNYAFRLMQFPIGIIGVSLAAATLPAVSKKLAVNDAAGAALDLNRSLRTSFAVNAPAAAGLMVAGLPIIQMLFQHGRFGAEDSRQTAAALFWYALGLPGYSAVKIMVPAFYALGNTRFPVMASFFSVALNAALNHVLLNVFHYPFWALAVATSATATLNAVVLALILRHRLKGSLDARLVLSMAVHAALSAAVAATAWLAIRGMDRFAPSFPRFAQVSLAMLAGVGIWIALGRVFRIPEIDALVEFFVGKLKKDSQKAKSIGNMSS